MKPNKPRVNDMKKMYSKMTNEEKCEVLDRLHATWNQDPDTLKDAAFKAIEAKPTGYFDVQRNALYFMGAAVAVAFDPDHAGLIAKNQDSIAFMQGFEDFGGC